VDTSWLSHCMQVLICDMQHTCARLCEPICGSGLVDCWCSVVAGCHAMDILVMQATCATGCCHHCLLCLGSLLSPAVSLICNGDQACCCYMGAFFKHQYFMDTTGSASLVTTGMVM
jgi:hypothetical protein